MAEASDRQTPPPESSQPKEDELEAWLKWLQELAEVGSTLSRLGAAEVRLATSDLRRYFIASLLILPLVLLAWSAFGVLLAWLAYEFTGLPVMGFGTFFLLQLLALLYLRTKIASYRNNMTLPATRKQIRLIMEDAGFASKKADS